MFQGSQGRYCSPDKGGPLEPPNRTDWSFIIYMEEINTLQTFNMATFSFQIFDFYNEPLSGQLHFQG